MPSRHKYSINADPVHGTASYGRELPISQKHSMEICREIKGMNVDTAKSYLKDVISLKNPVPFKKHNKKVAHRKMEGWDAGKFPEKAASGILKLLENAEKNAEYKGLNSDEIVIKHITASKGRQMKGFYPRAMGRTTPKRKITTNIEMILEEVQ
ncbi:MAG: 50S ribosomal protein L22P [Candidatus Methanolliviera sp. GoM_asphalt]|nr:MAG: 50S ribosomal protein L22P [Candidatus Methanolliviera sp. GoM_asphalt]